MSSKFSNSPFYFTWNLQNQIWLIWWIYVWCIVSILGLVDPHSCHHGIYDRSYHFPPLSFSLKKGQAQEHFKTLSPWTSTHNLGVKLVNQIGGIIIICSLKDQQVSSWLPSLSSLIIEILKSAGFVQFSCWFEGHFQFTFLSNLHKSDLQAHDWSMQNGNRMTSLKYSVPTFPQYRWLWKISFSFFSWWVHISVSIN